MLHIYWERFCKWFTAYVFPHSRKKKKQWKESFLLLSTLEWKSASTSTFLPGIPAPRARQFKLSWLLFVVVWHKRKKKTMPTKTRGKTFLINILNENIVTLLFLSLGRLTYVIFFPFLRERKKGGKERPIFAFPPRSRLTLDSPGQISMCFCWLGGGLWVGRGIVWDDDFKLWWCFFYAMLLTTRVCWFVVVLPAGVENFWVINCFFFLFYRSRWELATSSVVGCVVDGAQVEALTVTMGYLGVAKYIFLILIFII